MAKTKLTEEEKAQKEIEAKFASRIQFSVKVLRPALKYPYERCVWESTVDAPITDSSEKIEAITQAWIKTMEAGIELASAFRDTPLITDQELERGEEVRDNDSAA